MTDLPAQDLLADLRRLRDRTRADRRAFAVPLLGLGLLVLLAPLSFPASPAGSYLNGGDEFLASRLYWAFAVTAGFLGTAAWYRHRGNRSGIKTPTRGYLTIGAIGGVAILLGLPLVASVGYRISISPFERPWVAIPVIVATGLTAALLAWAQSRLTGSSQRSTAGVAILLGFVSLSVLDVYFVTLRPFAPLVIIALGLAGLAVAERSRVLGVVAALFAGATLLANLYNMENVFGLSQGEQGDQRVIVLTNLLLPGLILLAGAAAGRVRR